jgi:uridine phosphorylase
MRQEESLIRPKPFQGFRGARILYVPVDVPSGIIRKHLFKSASKIKTTEWGTLCRIGEKIVLFQAMGAPLAVMTFERLIAGGADEVLVLGFCGSLNPGLGIGSAVIVDRAYADEGTSRRYLPGRKYFRGSSDLRKTVEKKLSAGNLPFARAAAVSTDAPFRETPGWIRAARKKGCDVVDMEISAVFALAAFRGIRAAALFLVSDELFAGTSRDEHSPVAYINGRVRRKMTPGQSPEPPPPWRHGFFDDGLDAGVKSYFLPFL